MQWCAIETALKGKMPENAEEGRLCPRDWTEIAEAGDQEEDAVQTLEHHE